MSKEVNYLQELNCYFFECPHCNGGIIVNKNEVNCKIFRHGYLKGSSNQIDSHAPKDYCDHVVEENLVYGCAKPIKLIYEGTNVKFAIKDDYN